MVDCNGIEMVLDLDACYYFSKAGPNLTNALISAATERRIAITKETLQSLKGLDKELSVKIEQSSIEMIEPDETIYSTSETLLDLLVASGVIVQRSVSEKVVVLAVVHQALNGAEPPCRLITGDVGKHLSSMNNLCEELGISYERVQKAF